MSSMPFAFAFFSASNSPQRWQLSPFRYLLKPLPLSVPPYSASFFSQLGVFLFIIVTIILLKLVTLNTFVALNNTWWSFSIPQIFSSSYVPSKFSSQLSIKKLRSHIQFFFLLPNDQVDSASQQLSPSSSPLFPLPWPGPDTHYLMPALLTSLPAICPPSTVVSDLRYSNVPISSLLKSFKDSLSPQTTYYLDG